MSDVLEDRLRRTFDAVAATSDEPAIDVTEPPRSRRPIALVAASLLVVLGLAATMFAVRSDDDPAPAADLPAWYQAIEPALPDGFDHIAVVQSGSDNVMFQIVDPESPAVLYVRVSRVPVQPDPSGTMTLAALEAGSPLDESVQLPDGREVSVSCAVVTLQPDDGTTPCTQLARPVTADELRALALRLARDVPIDVLPPSDPESETGSDDFPLEPAVLKVASVAESAGFARQHWGFMEYSIEPDAASVLQVRYVHGLVPPVDTPHLRQEIAGATLTWRISRGSLVTVISRSPLPTATGDDILAAIDTVPPSTSPTWNEMLFPALPEGFEHIAIVESDDRHVSMEALNLSTGHVIRMRADRGRSRPDDQTPPADAVVVTAPDGRTVSITCVTVATEPGCPKIAGQIPTQDQLAVVADALLSIPVEVLPDPTVLPPDDGMLRATMDGIRAIGFSSVEGLGNTLMSDWTAEWEGSDLRAEVRARFDIVPPVDTAVPRRSLSIGGRIAAWQALPDGSLWTVSGPEPLDQETADRILDAIAGLPVRGVSDTGL